MFLKIISNTGITFQWLSTFTSLKMVFCDGVDEYQLPIG